MKTSKGLKIIILMFFLIVIASPAINSLACNFVEAGIKSMIVTGIIAYAIYSIAIGCLLKFGFNYGTFEICYIVIINIFPFIFFYILGIVMLEYTVNRIGNIYNFLF